MQYIQYVCVHEMMSERRERMKEDEGRKWREGERGG